MDDSIKKQTVGFTYTVTDEQVRKHMALSPDAVLQWIQEMATFVYELQTPEQRERKYDFKPNKRIHPDLLRRDI